MGLNTAEEKIHELEDIALEGIQYGTHRGKNLTCMNSAQRAMGRLSVA